MTRLKPGDIGWLTRANLIACVAVAAIIWMSIRFYVGTSLVFSGAPPTESPRPCAGRDFVKCRVDGVPPMCGVDEPGDVVSEGDCVMYPRSAAVYCISCQRVLRVTYGEFREVTTATAVAVGATTRGDYVRVCVPCQPVAP